MYDFAKAHPEISWVLKLHPGLFFEAVRRKVFPTLKDFEKYLQQWNDLPNAQVHMGGYYQAIFATSDGIINDSGSFTAEYQFVDKPMIFLTREGGKFNDLAHKIFEASYLVDGKDLDGIAATIQKVFLEGKDDKAAKRKEVFDKYLNYPKFNGISASEFHIVAKKVLADGFTKFIFGEIADTIYGGLDSLLSKDWTFGEFVDPYKVLRESQLPLKPFQEF